MVFLLVTGAVFRFARIHARRAISALQTQSTTDRAHNGDDEAPNVQPGDSRCAKKAEQKAAFELCLETVGHLTAALGKLCHDLLVQPYVHFRRAIEGARIAKFLRQLLAGAKAAV
jgi:hypothetical protein